MPTLRIRTSLIAVLIAAALAGCLGRGEPTSQTSIDERFRVDGFAWGSGAVIYLFVGARQENGKVAICAAYMPTGGARGTSQWDTDVLASGVVTLDGERILQGVDFANELAESKQVRGKPAQCVVSSVPWSSRFDGSKPEVDFPRRRFVD